MRIHVLFPGINLIILLITVVVIGCSGGSGGGSSPVTPPIGDEQLQLTGQTEPGIPDTGVPHYLLGFWQILINTETGEIEQIPVRGSGFHLNIVNQMQDPMPPGLSIEIIDMNLPEGWLDFNLGITHPFPNTNLRLFDVRGIMMGAGSTIASEADPTATRPAFSGFRVVNADGYTRWWNAQEFTTPGFFGYEPGNFGFDFTPVATINAYKYYSDPLSATDPVIPGVTPENRGTFSTDLDPPTLTRNFQLQVPVPDGLPIWLIQYAIDVNWAMPTGGSPTPKPVDDFPPEANCPEAFHIGIDTSGTSAFYIDEGNNGGNIQLAIEVFDWGASSNPDGIDGEIESITVESLTLFDAPVDVPVNSTGGSSISGIFNVTIPSVHPTSLEGQQIFITVKSTGVTTYISPIGFPAYPADAELAAYSLVDIPILNEDPYTGFIEVLLPNGGEQWKAGDSAEISWGADPLISDVRIELSTNSGADYPIEVTASTPNDGSFTWETIPVEAISDNCRIRISDVDLPASNDESDDDFEIAYGALELVVPNGNLAWYTQTSQEIKWTGGFGIENISIALSIDSGQNYTYLITPSTPNDGSFLWDLNPEEVVGEQCRIKVRDESSPEIFDESDDDFKVITNPITINTPNGGETWTVGTTQEILWDADPGIANVKIALSLDSGETTTLLISGNKPNDGSFMWGPIPADVAGNNCRIKIRDSVAPNAFRLSKADFTIELDPLTLLSPNGGESWEVGDAMEITWTGAPFTNDIIIGLKIDGGEVSILITGPTPNDGSFTWNPIIPEAVSDDCTIKIRDADDPDTWDSSDGAFIINPAPVDVISPNGGEIWEVGEYHEITWTADPDIENVAIGLSLNSGAFFNALTQLTPNDGTWEWTAIPPELVSNQCRIKVKDVDNWVVYDISDADFTIVDVEPLIEIIQPNGGELIESGSEYEIKWSTGGWIGENVKIEYTLFDGAPNTIIESTENNGSFLWDPIPAIDSGTVRVKITSIEVPGAFGQSDEYFTIKLMHILVESPNGGEVWGIGDAAEIIWSADPDIENVRIGISFDSGQYFTYNITPSTPNDGSYIWDPIPPDAVGTHLRVTIKDVDNGDNQDTSNADFTIFDLSWPVTWGGSGDDLGFSITTDADDNVFVVGRTEPSGTRDCYFAKYNQFGNLQWEKTWGGTGADEVGRLSVDSQGNILISGSFEGTFDFDPGIGTDYLSSNGSTDAFLCKFDTNGNYLWGFGFGGSTGDDDCYGIVTIGTDIYIAGFFSGTNVDFDPGPAIDSRSSNGSTDIFLSKFNGSGELQWVQTFGGSAGESTYYLTKDNFGNLGLAGYFSTTVDFDPGPGVAMKTASGNSDAFVAIFDLTGAFQWVQTWGGTDFETADRLVFDALGNVYVTGWFTGTADFYPGPSEEWHTSNGGSDIFVSKFDPSGIYKWTRVWGSTASGNISDLPYSILEDGLGHILVSGYIAGDADFDPGSGIDFKFSNGSSDIFVSKFGSSGQYLGAVTWGGSGTDQGFDMVLRNPGYALVTGAFTGTVDLDPGPEVKLRTSNGQLDGFITGLSTDFPIPDGLIEVITPNGGEDWIPGFDASIEWTWSGDIPYVDIWLSLNSGAGYTIPIAINYPNSGNINVDPDIGWISDTARIQVSSSSDGGVVDESNNDFRIYDPETSGWAQTWGPLERSQYQSLVADNLGNIYVIGQFTGIVDFDSGPEIETRSSNGQMDIYLCKYDQSGGLIWVRTWGGTMHDQSSQLCIDSLGNVYVAGFFRTIVDFDPGSGEDFYTSYGTTADVFFTKFNPLGDYQWVRTFGGTGDDTCIGITTDTLDNIYLVGYIDPPLVDMDPGDGVDNFSSNGTNDCYISKFNSSGTYQWARIWGSTDRDKAYGVDVDNSSGVYITGYFNGTVDFDPGPPYVERTITGGTNDAFLSKFDSSGNFQWVTTWDADGARDLLWDGFTNVFVTGWFLGNVDFDGSVGEDFHQSIGLDDAYVTSYATSGAYNWTYTWGGDDSDTATRLAMDDDGNLYVCGAYQMTVDFDPDVTVNQFTSNGDYDMYLSKFDPSYDYLWTRCFGSTGYDHSHSVAVDGNDFVYTTGLFNGTIDFNPGVGTDWHTATGLYDSFLVKYLPDGSW